MKDGNLTNAFRDRTIEDAFAALAGEIRDKMRDPAELSRLVQLQDATRDLVANGSATSAQEHLVPDTKDGLPATLSTSEDCHDRPSQAQLQPDLLNENCSPSESMSPENVTPKSSSVHMLCYDESSGTFLPVTESQTTEVSAPARTVTNHLCSPYSSAELAEIMLTFEKIHHGRMDCEMAISGLAEKFTRDPAALRERYRLFVSSRAAQLSSGVGSDTESSAGVEERGSKQWAAAPSPIIGSSVVNAASPATLAEDACASVLDRKRKRSLEPEDLTPTIELELSTADKRCKNQAGSAHDALEGGVYSSSSAGLGTTRHSSDHGGDHSSGRESDAGIQGHTVPIKHTAPTAEPATQHSHLPQLPAAPTSGRPDDSVASPISHHHETEPSEQDEQITSTVDGPLTAVTASHNSPKPVSEAPAADGQSELSAIHNLSPSSQPTGGRSDVVPAGDALSSWGSSIFGSDFTLTVQTGDKDEDNRGSDAGDPATGNGSPQQSLLSAHALRSGHAHAEPTGTASEADSSDGDIDDGCGRVDSSTAEIHFGSALRESDEPSGNVLIVSGTAPATSPVAAPGSPAVAEPTSTGPLTLHRPAAHTRPYTTAECERMLEAYAASRVSSDYVAVHAVVVQLSAEMGRTPSAVQSKLAELRHKISRASEGPPGSGIILLPSVAMVQAQQQAQALQHNPETRGLFGPLSSILRASPRDQQKYIEVLLVEVRAGRVSVEVAAQLVSQRTGRSVESAMQLFATLVQRGAGK